MRKIRKIYKRSSNLHTSINTLSMDKINKKMFTTITPQSMSALHVFIFVIVHLSNNNFYKCINLNYNNCIPFLLIKTKKNPFKFLHFLNNQCVNLFTCFSLKFVYLMSCTCFLNYNTHILIYVQPGMHEIQIFDNLILFLFFNPL